MVEKIDINVDKLKEYEKELVKYDGYLPSIIRWAISIDYMRNVLKSENSENILKQVSQSKTYSMEQFKKELVGWCKQNPKYSDIMNK